MANKPLQSIKFPDLPDTYTIPVVDSTLAVSGAAADAKQTGDSLADKVDKVSGKGLSTNDYTDEEKTKLAGVETGANKTVIDTTLTQTGQAADAKIVGDALVNLYPTDTATGAIAHFEDGADSIPMKDVLVHIEPVQEGSGDPSPENIRPITGWTGMQIWDDPKYGGLINWNQKLKNPHFDEGTNGLQYWASTNVSVSNLEDGSISLTITAVHETKAYHNMFRQDLATITTKQHKFLVLWDYKPAHTHNVYIYLLCSSGPSGNYSQTINNVPAGEWNRLAYFVPAQDRAFYQLQIALNDTVDSGYSVGDVDYIRYPQMFDLTEMFGAGNEPTTLDEFKALFPKDCYDYDSEVTCVSAVSGEPYAHVQVSWQSEAGTVYGGTLDVTSGVLTVEKYGIVVNGSNHRFEKYGNGNYWHIAPYDYPTIKAVSGDTRPTLVYSDITLGTNKWGTAQNGTQMFTRASDWTGVFNSVDELNAIDITVVYELATPITYTLTPQEITSLLGVNNLWADTGDSEVEYRADAKLYITKKITEAVSALS